MRSPVVFTVIMVSGMLLASAFLSFQLDWIYGQSSDPNSPPQHVDFNVLVNQNCDIDPIDGFIDCSPNDGATTTLPNPAFASDIELSCNIFGNPPNSATCLIDFRSPQLGGDDWDMVHGVACNVDSSFNLIDCDGTLDDENHN
jgi:hypothetical protein